DELDQCNEKVGKVIASATTKHSNRSTEVPMPVTSGGTKTRTYFPFKQCYLLVETLRVGSEGIQMTVHGIHITSFDFRETLEPWLVSEVMITKDIKVVSVVASGLPTSKDSYHIIEQESLKSHLISLKKKINLFIIVFSTANNFKRKMASRRTWMQYAAVKSGQVAVCFFVGLIPNLIEIQTASGTSAPRLNFSVLSTKGIARRKIPSVGSWSRVELLMEKLRCPCAIWPKLDEVTVKRSRDGAAGASTVANFSLLEKRPCVRKPFPSNSDIIDGCMQHGTESVATEPDTSSYNLHNRSALYVLELKEEEYICCKATLNKEFEDQRKEDHHEWQEKLKEFQDIMLGRSSHSLPT
nr:beta-1,3-galactosyltransferase GALT1 [Tanacetum cinerariifolium]